MKKLNKIILFQNKSSPLIFNFHHKNRTKKCNFSQKSQKSKESRPSFNPRHNINLEFSQKDIINQIISNHRNNSSQKDIKILKNIISFARI